MSVSRVLVFAVLGLSPNPIRAQTELLRNGPASIQVSPPVHDGVVQYEMSEPFGLSISVEGTAKLVVELPAPLIKSSTWPLLTVNQPVIEALAEKRVRWRQTFQFDPLLAARTHEVQVEPLRFREGGDWQTIRWPAFRVEVPTPKTTTTAADLREVTPIEELPAVPSLIPDWVWPMVAVGIAAVLLCAAARCWRPRRQSAPMSPEARAEHELRRIRALDLPARGATARFHALLANVLRGYLERRYGIGGRRRTTPELRLEIEQVAGLAENRKKELLDILEECDLARFAGQGVSNDVCEQRLTWAAEFVRDADSERQS